MRVPDSLQRIIGKVISGVVVADSPGSSPRCRIFLTFSDGTAFEFWEDEYGVEMAGDLEIGNVDLITTRLRSTTQSNIVAVRPPHQIDGSQQVELFAAAEADAESDCR